VDDRGHVTTTITQWDRKHWGGGGDDFHWWCTEDPAAFAGASSVYASMAEELTAMVGAAVYERLGAYLERRASGVVALPHPTVRSATNR